MSTGFFIYKLAENIFKYFSSLDISFSPLTQHHSSKIYEQRDKSPSGPTDMATNRQDHVAESSHFQMRGQITSVRL